LLGIFFDTEDGGDMLFKMLVGFQQTTWCYSPEAWKMFLIMFCGFRTTFCTIHWRVLVFFVNPSSSEDWSQYK
jgi:hypothetical protein